VIRAERAVLCGDARRLRFWRAISCSTETICFDILVEKDQIKMVSPISTIRSEPSADVFVNIEK